MPVVIGVASTVALPFTTSARQAPLAGVTCATLAAGAVVDSAVRTLALVLALDIGSSEGAFREQATALASPSTPSVNRAKRMP
jgi:hypothetical protein